MMFPTSARPPRRPIRMGGRRGRASRWGFTLFELLVVVTIIGVIGAIAAPRLGASTSAARLRAAADRLEADLGLARAHARRTSTSVTVTFASDGYLLAGVPDLVSGAAGYKVRLDLPPYEVGLRSSGFKLGSDLVFDAMGGADASPVFLLEHGKFAIKMEMDGSTGLVSRGDLMGR